jgi:hypothetical protein
MFGHGAFYHGHLKRYVGLFGSLFNDTFIQRGEGTSREQLIRVPVEYGPRDKMLARMVADPDLLRRPAVQLPVMSFEMDGLVYDNERKRPSTVGRRTRAADGDSVDTVYDPVPYNLHFAMTIYAKSSEDAHRVLEQVVPFFTPSWTVTIRPVAALDEQIDVPITLDPSPVLQDTYEGDFSQRRAVTWTLGFTMKAWFYGPVRNRPLIKTAVVDLFPVSGYDEIEDAVGQVDPVERITVRPGLTADGLPTSDPNSSVPLVDIHYDDNWGVITTYSQLLLE